MYDRMGGVPNCIWGVGVAGFVRIKMLCIFLDFGIMYLRVADYQCPIY